MFAKKFPNNSSRFICLFMAAMAMATAMFPHAAMAAPGAHGPNGEHLDAAGTGIATGLARLPDGSVNVPKPAQRRMALRTTMARPAQHPVTVELNGKVSIDPNAGGRVQAPFAARIAPGPRGLPVAGQRVQKGQVLLHLHAVSSAIERGNQQAQLADIRANYKLAEQRVKRLASLEGAVPQKEIDAARAELASLSGRQRAVADSIGGIDVVTAPASGVIASAHVMTGQIVEARELLLEIVDPNRLMVEASTTDVALAARIGAARLAGASGVELQFLGAARSLRDGALPLTFRARANGSPLAIGQPVTVIVQLTDKVSGIALPAEAVVRNPSNEFIVWIKSGAERFIPQAVEFMNLDAKTIVVTKGLAADNRVVVSGAALINQVR